MIKVNSVFNFNYLKNITKSKRFCNRFNGSSSNEWLKRRDMDPYISKARRENYRCRSAFKLIEIDEKFKLVKPGYNVLDVGASPGSWSQVLADRTNSNRKDDNKKAGTVIAIDLAHIYPIEGVTILSLMDFTKESSQQKINEILGGKKLDLVLSDMAPRSTGMKSLDQENIIALAFSVLLFAVKNLKQDGGCLIKIWLGQHQKFVEEMKRFFKQFNFIKPNSTYDSSSEMYLLGRNFIGLRT